MSWATDNACDKLLDDTLTYTNTAANRVCYDTDNNLYNVTKT